MSYKSFKKVYEKFIDQEAGYLEYPSILGYNPTFYNPVFGKVNNFFSKHGSRATYNPVPHTTYLDLVKKKGKKNIFEFKKSIWDRNRNLYEKNHSELKSRKCEWLERLNKKEYPEYFNHSKGLIDTLFETKAAKKAYRNNAFKFEQLLLIILCGKYSEIGLIQEYPDLFPPITNPELKECLESKIPIYSNGIIPKSELPKNVFLGELTRLKKVLLRINELENILNTINKIENISLNDLGPKIPSNSNFVDSINDEESKQKIGYKNFGQEKEDKLNEIIEDMASNTSGKKTSKYKSDTRRIYFKALIENPTLIRSDLINLITDTHTLDGVDEKKLKGKPTVLTTWEKNLREKLRKAGLGDLAQRLER